MSANKGTSTAMFGSPRFCERQIAREGLHEGTTAQHRYRQPLLIVGPERRVETGARCLLNCQQSHLIPRVLAIVNSAQRQILPSELRAVSHRTDCLLSRTIHGASFRHFT